VGRKQYDLRFPKHPKPDKQSLPGWLGGRQLSSVGGYVDDDGLGPKD
jgi:hypothetical protein